MLVYTVRMYGAGVCMYDCVKSQGNHIFGDLIFLNTGSLRRGFVVFGQKLVENKNGACFL